MLDIFQNFSFYEKTKHTHTLHVSCKNKVQYECYVQRRTPVSQFFFQSDKWIIFLVFNRRQGISGLGLTYAFISTSFGH